MQSQTAWELDRVIHKVPNLHNPLDLTIREQFIGEYRGLTYAQKVLDGYKASINEAISHLESQNQPN